MTARICLRARRTGNGQNRDGRRRVRGYDGRGEPCEAMHGSGEEQVKRQRVIQREPLGHGIDADVIYAVEDGGENVG